MTYLGDFRLGETFDFKFTTRQISGAPFTLASSPVISAYPGNSTTQLTAGITLSVDFDSLTGLNNVRVVATSGNGYATATNYALVITTGTVNSVSVVGEVVGHFSIEARSALMPTTAARTLDVSAGGEAGIDWANVGTPGSTVSLSATTVATVTTTATATAVTTVNGLAANVITATAIQNDAITAAKIANNAIDAATFAADVDAEILSYIVDDATRIDASALNTASVTTIPAILVDTAEIGAAGAGLTALASAANLATVDTVVDAIKVTTDKLDTALELDGAVYRYTTNALELAPSGSAPTAVENADALLGRNLAGGSDGGRMVKDALRILRNKTDIAAGTLTVYAEDDSTPAWDATVTTTAGNPISQIDPA